MSCLPVGGMPSLASLPGCNQACGQLGAPYRLQVRRDLQRSSGGMQHHECAATTAFMSPTKQGLSTAERHSYPYR